MRGTPMRNRRARGVIVALVLAAAMTVAACGEKKEETTASSGSGSSETAGKDCGKVVLNEQAWAGSTANTYIAKNVLEDWQHTDEYKTFIEEAGTVVDGGPLGVEGHIGWFIPKYLMDEHPEFAVSSPDPADDPVSSFSSPHAATPSARASATASAPYLLLRWPIVSPLIVVDLLRSCRPRARSG